MGLTKMISTQDKNRKAFDVFIVAALSALNYWLFSLAIPLAPGRDFGSFLAYYADFFEPVAANETLMLFRTPFTPFFIGLLNAIGGTVLLEWGMGFLFVSSIVAYFKGMELWSRKWAYVGTILILIYPPYSYLYHFLGSDSIFAWGFAVWFYLVALCIKRPSVKYFMLVGAWIFTVVMIRPVGKLMLLVCFLPFMLDKVMLRNKFIYILCCVTVSYGLILGWSYVNYSKYGHFTVSRGGSSFLPLNKFFIHYGIVDPLNGPMTKKMSDIVAENLLTKEPYISHGVTIEKFFHSKSPRIFLDFRFLCDEVFGKSVEFAPLGTVSYEAFATNPVLVLKNYIFDGYKALANIGFLPEPTSIGEQSVINSTAQSATFEEWIVSAKQSLERRLTSDNMEIIPISYYEMIVLDKPDEQLRRHYELKKRIANMGIDLPEREGGLYLSKFINMWGAAYPVPIWWLIFAVISLIYFDKEKFFLYIIMLTVSIGIVFVSVLGINLVYHYRVPFDALFILMGASLIANENITRMLDVNGAWILNIVGSILRSHTKSYQFLRFAAGGIVVYVLSVSTMLLMTTFGNRSYLLNYAITQLLVFPISLLLNRNMVFLSCENNIVNQSFLYIIALLCFRVIDWSMFTVLVSCFSVVYPIAIFMSVLALYPIKFIAYRCAVFGKINFQGPQAARG